MIASARETGVPSRCDVVLEVSGASACPVEDPDAFLRVFGQ